MIAESTSLLVGVSQCVCSSELNIKVNTVTKEFKITCPCCAEFYSFGDDHKLKKKKIVMLPGHSFSYPEKRYVWLFEAVYKNELSFFDYTVSNNNNSFVIKLVRIKK